MKLRPLHDWAVIQPKEAQEKTASGIVIPDVAKEKPQEGIIIAIGEGRYTEELDKKTGKVIEKKFVPTVLKPGDCILYERFGETRLKIDGEELVLVREENILGTLE